MRSAWKYVVCFAAAGAAMSVGAFVRPDAWYAALEKPALTPPNWIFGPVWTTLYVLMAIAAGRVWSKTSGAAVTAPLGLYFAQLLLNGLWSILFFGWHRPDLAFYDLVGLWLCIVAMLVAFFRKDRLAGAILVPYVLWVSFASYLNFGLWRLNP